MPDDSLAESSFAKQTAAVFLRLAGLAKRDQAELEIIFERSDSLRLSANNGQLSTFDSSQSHVAGLRVILNGVEGYCWVESLQSDDLEIAYLEALENARFTAMGLTADQIALEAIELYESPTPAGEDPTLFSSDLSSISIDDKIARAVEIEKRTKAADLRIGSVPYSGYRENSREIAVFNTRGVCARQRRTAVSGYSYCVAQLGDESRMAGGRFFTRDTLMGAITEIDVMGQVAAEKAISKLGATTVQTGRYPIVIDRDVVAELFGLMADYFSAKSVSERTSIFSHDLGNQIASPLISVVDDPTLSAGFGSRSFDAEGAATKRTQLVEAGVLLSFLTNSVYAKKMKLAHTASATRSPKGELSIGSSNLVVAAGQDEVTDLLKAYPRLIYVTDFTGYHAGFSEGSGEFSFQSEGELWENGKRVNALCNFVVAGSIRELLIGVEKVSSRLSKQVSNVIAPDLLIRSLSVAGEKR